MNTKLIILILLALPAFKSFSQDYNIKAEITDLGDGAMAKLYNFDYNELLDSCEVKGGKFEFSGDLEYPFRGLIRIYAKNEDSEMGMDVFYNRFYLDKADYQVTTTAKEFSYSTFTTTRGANLDYNNFKLLTRDLQTKQEEIQESAYAGKQIDPEEFNQLRKDIENTNKAYLRTNLDAYPALDLLNTYVQGLQALRWAPDAPLAMSEDSIKYYFSQLDRRMKRTLKGEAIYTSLYGNKVTGEGQAYIEFEEAITLNEKSFKVADVNTEYVLLDFTAVHCGWCKKFDAELLPHYDQIKDKIEVVSFFRETDIDMVRKDIEEHQIPWKVVSDYKGDFSPTCRRYQITGTPDFYLLDKERNIIKHVEGYDEKFIEYLADLGAK